jgi:hypothetical protein
MRQACDFERLYISAFVLAMIGLYWLPDRPRQGHTTDAGTAVLHTGVHGNSNPRQGLALILVPTTPLDFDKRLLHRSTWMRFVDELPFMHALFVMGPTDNALANVELARYNDTVVVPAKVGGVC